MGWNKRRGALIIATIAVSLLVQLANSDGVRLPDQPEQDGHSAAAATQGVAKESVDGRQGRHLLDFIGLGTGSTQDPYQARTNTNCLNGELAECFKSQALNTFTEFFSKDSYTLSENARIVRYPESHFRSLEHEPFEYSSESRATDSEWDQLVKFALRKTERFLKSAAFEVAIPDEVIEDGRYSPRFVDEIADEIDVIEDKKAPLFSRNRLKKLFIPMLLILKLFKLKLLLFLPLILGLASFKKLLGFLAIIIPGVIGYFKLCRPQSYDNSDYYTNGVYPQYSAQGIGSASYQPQSPFGGNNYYGQRPQPSFSAPHGAYYRDTGAPSEIYQSQAGGVRFGDDNAGQDLAYGGNAEFRNKKVE